MPVGLSALLALTSCTADPDARDTDLVLRHVRIQNADEALGAARLPEDLPYAVYALDDDDRPTLLHVASLPHPYAAGQRGPGFDVWIDAADWGSDGLLVRIGDDGDPTTELVDCASHNNELRIEVPNPCDETASQ